MNIEHVFVINLKTRQDRWNEIKNQFKNTDLKLIRWNAVYGKDLSEKQIRAITSDFCNVFCSHGIVGCWLSHYTLWQFIVKHNIDNVLVLEDDAKPVTEFNSRISTELKKIPKDYDLVYFGCSGSCDKIGDDVIGLGYKKNKVISDDLIIPTVPLGTHAYLISNKGAQKLLSYRELKKVRYHIDCSLSNYVYNNNKDFNMYAFKKPLIMQSSDVNSSDLLSNDHPILNYFTSYVKLSDNYNLDYVLSCQQVQIRKLKVDITSYFVLFGIIAFVIGWKCSEINIRNFICIIVILYAIELLLQKKINWNTKIAELLCMIVFLYLGNKLNNYQSGL
jgi:glycosyl transferase family 25